MGVGLIFLLALSATRAEAHTVISTNGPFFGGLKHFFLSPDDVLATVAFGLFVRLSGPRRHGVLVLALPGAWFIAGAVALFIPAAVGSGELLSACSLMGLGLLVALDRKFHSATVVTIGILGGGLHGFLNGASMREAGAKTALLQLGGVAVAALSVAFYLLSVLDLLNLEKRPWVRIVARVLGSWIAASGLLLLGWSLRPVH
jgi:hydrogenase/urease accessory protein HupE